MMVVAAIRQRNRARPATYSTRWAVLMCASVLALVLAARPVTSTAFEVFGYCQAPRAAMFRGGFGGAAADNSCYRGVFGQVGVDGSVLSAHTCTGPDGASEWSTCTCLGVPQCTLGEKCNYDCGCSANATGAAAINSYFTANRKLTFAGSIVFGSGSAPVQCDNYVPEGSYLHGYTVTLVGYESGASPTLACGSDAEKPTTPGNWTCMLDLDLSATPFAPTADKPATFGQVFKVTNGSPTSQLRAVMAIVAVTLVVSTLRDLWW